MDARSPAPRRRLRARSSGLQDELEVLRDPFAARPPPLARRGSERRRSSGPNGPPAHVPVGYGGRLSRVLSALKYPLGILLGLWALLLAEHHYLAMLEPLILYPTQTICGYSAVRNSSLCPPAGTTTLGRSNAYFDKVLAQEAEFVSIQKMVTTHNTVSSQLSASLKSFDGVALALMYRHPPLIERLQPLVQILFPVVSHAAACIEDAIHRTNQLMVHTLKENSEPETELRVIEIGGNPFLAPLRWGPKLLGHRTTSQSGLSAILSSFASKLYAQTNDVLHQHQTAILAVDDLQKRMDIVVEELRRSLNTATVAELPEPSSYLGMLLPFRGKKQLKAVRLDVLEHSSPWKSLLHAFKDSIPNFDVRIESCAQMYQSIATAKKLFSATIESLHRARAELETLQADASLVADEPSSIQLTVESIRKTSKYVKLSYLSALAAQEASNDAFRKMTATARHTHS